MAIRAAANQSELVQRFGRVQSLEIDPSTHRIFLSILLKGESEPIQATLQYSLEARAENQDVVISSVECSKPWIHQLAALIIEKNGSFRLPLEGSLGKMIVMIL
jgi:hypothetical protein